MKAASEPLKQKRNTKKMGKAFNNISFVASALCFLSLLVYAHGDAHFIVQGRVYCDTCRAQFITEISEYMKGAKVRLECRDDMRGDLTFSEEAETDESGTYRIFVDNDHEEDVCEVILVKSSNPDCAEIPNDDHLRKAAKISLTNNNGVVSDVRRANPLGFLRKERLPECTEVLRKLGITDKGFV